MFKHLILTPADIIEIIGIITSLITSLVAIIISVKTLKQNSKMIEESTRPYVSIYPDTTNFASPTTYLIMKNYGSSSAFITSFSSDTDLSLIAYDNEHIPFANIEGVTLCPGASLRFPIKRNGLPRDAKIYIAFAYKSQSNFYAETSTINLAAYSDILHHRSDNKNDRLRDISFSVQDIAEKML